MADIRVGIAGWSKPPAQRYQRETSQSQLAFYSSRFSCVEINSSFYRPHRPTTYERWRDGTPPGFRFSVKVPRAITHESGLRRVASQVSRFYDEIAYLRPKIKAVLVQLPPTLEYSARIARAFFQTIPRLRGMVIACEPRHESWFTAKADAALCNLEVTRVAADPARCAVAAEAGGKRRFAYYRWHGSPRMYYSKYTDAQLLAFAAGLNRTRAKETWCIFDNTARYHAWDDALRLAGLLAGR